MPCKKLLSKNTILTISHVMRFEKLDFLLVCKTNSHFVAPQKDCHGHAIWQQQALYKDFAKNNGSGCNSYVEEFAVNARSAI